jgi:hypothetical protein
MIIIIIIIIHEHKIIMYPSPISTSSFPLGVAHSRRIFSVALG